MIIKKNMKKESQGFDVDNEVLIKKQRSDDNSDLYYVFDIHDVNGACIALNRYVLVEKSINNSVKCPFEMLTEEEEKTLNDIPNEVIKGKK